MTTLPSSLVRNAWALLCLAGCGRIAFDPVGGDALGAGDGALPSQVCQVDRIPLTSVPANADLIATRLNASGFVALVSDTQFGASPIGVQLDAQRQPITGPRTLGSILGPHLGSLADLDNDLFVVTSVTVAKL